ncbi:NAD(P)-binding protein [Oxyplasma meridianum]|uniref:NAD(P)-binding protein n=1 Tax=Oxyplasma meridianum TaxID=3073602 RepID=A0AAX4NHV1_9ARCH
MHPGESGYIGNLKIKNRIVMAPMISNLGNPDGSTNENHISYLEARAKGGFGLIITEYTFVNNRNSRGSVNETGVYDRKFIPKFRRLTERVHMHGARTFMQLVHAGGKASQQYNRMRSFAPSSVDYIGTTPWELTQEDISDIIEDFVHAARNAKDSFFDGIELHGAHGYLISEFMSPTLNRRTDRYGGDLERRLRFPQEVVDAIRSEMDFPVGMRISLYENGDNAYHPEYGLKIAENIKNLDYVHFSAGIFNPPGSSASFYDSRTHIFNQLPRRPAVTTMVVGSVMDLEDAERVLSGADFVAVARPSLADPYFAMKLLESNVPLRPCIRCNQACRDLALGEVRCTVNPETGLENYNQKHYVQKLNGHIAVSGGGIKGMEAALEAAKHGLKVTLYHNGERLGGQLLSIADKRKAIEFSKLIEYYEKALEMAEVEVKLNSENGSGIICTPDKVYPDLPEKDEIWVDSNIYKHHDQALEWSENHKVYMSSRSLSSLDRSRALEYKKLASEKGIVFVDHAGKDFDISIIERNQYDIRSAIVSGRELIRKYIERNSLDYL